MNTKRVLDAAPLIGVTTYAADETSSVTLPVNYIDSVRRAGGIPVLIAPGESHTQQLAARLDGIVLAGGGDICPSIYGGTSHDTVYMVNPERDRTEFALARCILKHSIPTLAICRGTQIINVLLDGTLHPHLPDVVGESVLHRAPPREPIEHPVSIEANSRTAKILEADQISTMSWHHQAIDRLGDGLQVVARAPDGVVEAVELAKTDAWLIAVQWHPEITASTDRRQQRLFDELVKAAVTNKQ